MPKILAADTDRKISRKQAIEALRKRGPASKENSVKDLRERVALLEKVVGLEA
jgi:hypothetical protein